MPLTREDFLNTDDATIKAIIIPAHIEKWGGKEIYIRQLTRGQQDAYLKRRFSNMAVNTNGANQEMKSINIFGHDAWLVSKGACDENGKPLFKEADIEKLNEKNGEFIGWIAVQIVSFSSMGEDAQTAEKVSEEIKN